MPSIKEILSSTAHRPRQLPDGKWRFYQEWHDALFLHWKVPHEELAQFVPKELEIDLFEGEAWVSLVAFRMEKMRPKNLPALSAISTFEEINIRTYVKSKGKLGVYFLSIEASSRISCFLAKIVSKLPYRHSKIKRTPRSINSLNTDKRESFGISYTIGEPIRQKSNLDIWLTERYALCQDHGNSFNAYDIHHLEWPLNSLEIEDLVIEYPRFESLINTRPDSIHYSKGTQVLAWQKKTIKHSE